MLSEKKYSFVIPTIGSRDNISKIIEAIKQSGLKDCEIVVILQISELTSRDIISQLEKFNGINIITVRGHISTSMARNMGAEASKGKILCFIDDDVLPTPTLFTFLNSIDNIPHKIFFPEIKNREYVPFPLGDHVGGKAFVSACFIMGRKEYLNLGGMNENLWFFREDSELFIRAVKNGMKLEFIPDAYVWHPVRFTTHRAIMNMFKKQQREPLFHHLVSGDYAGVFASKPFSFQANRHGFSVASYFLIASSIFICVSALILPLLLFVAVTLYLACAVILSLIYFRNPRIFLGRKWSKTLAKISIYMIIFPVFILARAIGSIRYRHFTL